MPRNVAITFLFLLAWGCAGGAQAATDEDIQLVANVAKKIFAEVEPPEGLAWPPLVFIVNYEGGSIDEDRDGEIDGDEINAKASAPWVKPDKGIEWESDTSVTPVPVPGFDAIVPELDADGEYRQPVIRVYQGWLSKIIEGDENRLANTFGHEMQHILLGHVTTPRTGTPLVEFAVSRQQEADADIAGFALALSAGYTEDVLMESLRVERERLSRYTSFQVYSGTHPGYTDRVAMVETHRPEIWRALSAFENGVWFLNAERYDMAADCFREVVARAPECFEGWANLGYAELMQYYEGLGEETLRSYDVGQLALGGYYNQAASLGIRGADRERWQSAVEALERALTLNSKLVVARANLAAAQLLHPDGKQVGAAAQEFAQVIAGLERGEMETGVDPRMHAALLVNAGVVELADGDSEGAEKLFTQARGLFESPEAFDGVGLVASAARYNRAMMLARSSAAADQRAAIDEYATYLGKSSESLAWWSLAYDAYERLCRAQGVEPKPRAELTAGAAPRRRMVAGVKLASGERIALDQPMEAVEAALGPGVRNNQVRNTNVHRRRYAKAGLDLMCNNRVLAIRLVGKTAPPVVLESSGPGPGATAEVRPGMTFDELRSLVGEDADLWDRRWGVTSTIEYRYFYRLGFGVRVTDAGKILEVIVAQIPQDAKIQSGN
jgi:tetratricopeptide (TPR) repeat protein